MDWHLRSLIYNPKFDSLRNAKSSPLDWLHFLRNECGGRSQDILKLDNQHVSDYHRRHYQLNRLSIILCGQDVSIYEALGLLDGYLKNIDMTSIPAESEICVDEMVDNVCPTNAIYDHVFSATEHWQSDGAMKIAKFAASDASYGSMGFAWRGPLVSDLKTLVALDVITKSVRFLSISLYI